MKSTNNTTMKKAIATAVAALVLSTSMLLTGCGEPGSTTPETQQETTAKVEKETNTSSQTAEKNNDSGLTSDTSKTNDKANGSTSEKTADSKSSDNKDSASNKSSDANNTNTNSNKSESKQNNNSKPNSNSNNNSKPNNTDSHAGKTYHEAVYKTVHHDAEYKDVYVVDQKAYSYEEPVYTERQITVCHVCGAEFDTSYSASAFYAHGNQHLLAGEGSGYHSEVREIQTGSKTVNVPEEGHYEKKVVKDAWDEKVLVKEAGWY